MTIRPQMLGAQAWRACLTFALSAAPTGVSAAELLATQGVAAEDALLALGLTFDWAGEGALVIWESAAVFDRSDWADRRHIAALLTAPGAQALRAPHIIGVTIPWPLVQEMVDGVVGRNHDVGARSLDAAASPQAG